jgi:hypothetical protein
VRIVVGRGGDSWLCVFCLRLLCDCGVVSACVLRIGVWVGWLVWGAFWSVWGCWVWGGVVARGWGEVLCLCSCVRRSGATFAFSEGGRRTGVGRWFFVLCVGVLWGGGLGLWGE